MASSTRTPRPVDVRWLFKVTDTVGTWGWGTFVSYQFELRGPFDPAVPLLGVHHTGRFAHVHREAGPRLGALFELGSVKGW